LGLEKKKVSEGGKRRGVVVANTGRHEGREWEEGLSPSEWGRLLLYPLKKKGGEERGKSMKQSSGWDFACFGIGQS